MFGIYYLKSALTKFSDAGKMRTTKLIRICSHSSENRNKKKKSSRREDFNLLIKNICMSEHFGHFLKLKKGKHVNKFVVWDLLILYYIFI